MKHALSPPGPESCERFLLLVEMPGAPSSVLAPTNEMFLLRTITHDNAVCQANIRRAFAQPLFLGTMG